MIEVLKVSSKSNPNSVAGALAGVIRGAGSVEIQVVGAGALNQAIKAVAIARGYLASSGMDLTCRPTFADIEIEGENRTAIRLLVEAFDTRATSAWSQPAAWADGESPGPATDDADTDDAADDNPAQPPAGKRSADAAAADGHAAPSLELGTT